jgi:DNA-binding MarR family transcriptional regulator
MNPVARPANPSTEPRTEVEELRHSLNQLFGAERRLRGRDHSGPGQLTFGQLRSIAALGREREMTAGQLAKSADLNPASVTAMLDHLEAANIVQRLRSTEDRRVCKVSLTPEGWELLERKLAGWQALWEEKLSEFSVDEVEAAARILHQLTEMFDALAPVPAAQPG